MVKVGGSKKYCIFQVDGECQFYNNRQAQNGSLPLCLLDMNFDSVFIFLSAAGGEAYIILVASYYYPHCEWGLLSHFRIRALFPQ